MKINILHLIDGAKAARGLTVIIDVFRAFSVETYLMHQNASKIIPVGDKDFAFDYRRSHSDVILCGERGGVIIDGFDYGNSPTQIENIDFSGKTIIHTTSAGTQGIVNAKNATEIIGGNLICAKAISEYIRRKAPSEVSLVCMGLMAKEPTEEDTLAAEYIKSLIEDSPFPDLEKRIAALRESSGAKFFDPGLQQIYPMRDFELCTRANSFSFVLRLKRGQNGEMDHMERVDIFDI